jgi:hypothetical protein
MYAGAHVLFAGSLPFMHLESDSWWLYRYVEGYVAVVLRRRFEQQTEYFVSHFITPSTG